MIPLNHVLTYKPPQTLNKLSQRPIPPTPCKSHLLTKRNVSLPRIPTPPESVCLKQKNVFHVEGHRRKMTSLREEAITVNK